MGVLASPFPLEGGRAGDRGGSLSAADCQTVANVAIGLVFRVLTDRSNGAGDTGHEAAAAKPAGCTAPIPNPSPLKGEGSRHLLLQSKD